MFKQIQLLFILTLISAATMCQKVVLEGHYRGENFFVQNLFSGDDTTSYCVDSISVNDKIIFFKNGSAFQIKLDTMGFILEEKLEVIIYHKKDCKPKILNQTHTFKTTTNYLLIKLDSLGKLSWITTEERSRFIFNVEQFKWNRWVKVGEVDGVGGNDTNHYHFNANLHSGENKLRLKQIDLSRKRYYSKSVSTFSESSKIDYSLTNKFIRFSDFTIYELYDKRRNIIKKGESNKIDISNLRKGNYQLNFDNRTEKFKIK